MSNVLDVDGVDTLQARLDRLGAYKAALEAAAYIGAKLFKSPGAITANTVLSGLEEANFSGYAPIDINAFSATFLKGDGTAWMTTPLLIWQQNGGGISNDVYSVGIVRSTGNAATGTVGETGGIVDTPVVTAGGTGYLLPPAVTIADSGGGTGTGALAHAEITAGVVTAIVIDDGGTGYTTPLVTIERPVRLIAGKAFDAAQQMASTNDGIECIVQLEETD